VVKGIDRVDLQLALITITMGGSAIYMGILSLWFIAAWLNGSWTYHADGGTFTEIFLIAGLAISNAIMATQLFRLQRKSEIRAKSHPRVNPD
jgi:hypothetical protein